ncbi:MAG: thioredoxin family protein [bacterium]
MMIEILGTGCPKCKKLYELVQEAVKEVGCDANVIKVEDIKQIMNRGVMITPALVIDGEVKVAGRIPRTNEIKGWIQK